MTIDPNLPFKQLKLKVQEIYKATPKVYCPALRGDVHFTSEGFHHLRYDGSLKERKKPEQRNKLSHFPYAVITIKLSATIQEYRTFLEPVGLKDPRGFRKTARVHYFAFWAVLENKVRVKAIVKRVEGGQLSFWSVMPFWTEQLVDGKRVKVFASAKIVDE